MLVIRPEIGLKFNEKPKRREERRKWKQVANKWSLVFTLSAEFNRFARLGIVCSWSWKEALLKAEWRWKRGEGGEGRAEVGRREKVQREGTWESPLRPSKVLIASQVFNWRQGASLAKRREGGRRWEAGDAGEGRERGRRSESREMLTSHHLDQGEENSFHLI